MVGTTSPSLFPCAWVQLYLGVALSLVACSVGEAQQPVNQGPSFPVMLPALVQDAPNTSDREPTVKELPAPQGSGINGKEKSAEETITPPESGTAPAPAASVVTHRLSLAQCKALALERQPAIAAANASLQAALARKHALDQLRVPTVLQPDLPIRRLQAATGLKAMEAGVRQAQLEATHAVQYAYVSYLYAQTQLQIADRTLEGLYRLREELEKRIRADEKSFEKWNKMSKKEQDARPENSPDRVRTDLLRERDLNRVDSLIELARGKRAEAEWGAKRALSLLREATVLPADFCFAPVEDRLFDVTAVLDGKQLVELALTHRPELLQAQVALEVHQLEVQAQQHARGLRVATFASAVDLHVQPLPATASDGDYRPGATGPEMPVTINGCRSERVHQASVYAERAAAVLERSRGLIRLQVEQAYLRAQEMQAKWPRFELGAAKALIAQKYTGVPFFGKLEETTLTQLITTAAQLTELRIAAVEARYQYLLALLRLEWHTAGAFCAGLDKAPLMPSPTTLILTPAEEEEVKKTLQRLQLSATQSNPIPEDGEKILDIRPSQKSKENPHP